MTKHTNSDPDDEEEEAKEASTSTEIKTPAATPAAQTATPSASKARAASKTSKGFTASGFCCQDGKAGDLCSGCFTENMVEQGAYCASENKCSSSCGGTWCKSTCVLPGAKPSDWCMSAYKVSIANSSNYCSKSAKTCGECSGQWCARVAYAPDEAATPTADAEDKGDKETKPKAEGFCCYDGSNKKDVCGTCYKTSIADNWSCAQSADACSACKGTWCGGNTTISMPTVAPASDDKQPTPTAEAASEDVPDDKVASKADSTAAYSPTTETSAQRGSTSEAGAAVDAAK